MKLFLWVTLLFISFSCRSFKGIGIKGVKDSGIRSDSFLIRKIESKNDSIFIIYATKKDSVYKIVSFKDYINESKKIEVGKSYDLKLKDLLILDGMPSELYNPGNYAIMIQHLEGVIFHENPINFEKKSSIDHIYVALNLNGLCLRE